MKKILLATAMLLSLSGQVFAQNMIPDESTEAPKVSPTIQKIVADNQHVSLCMAIWGSLAKMDVGTGLSLIDNPATTDLGTKFLNDSQIEAAKMTAALGLAVETLPPRIKAEGRPDVSSEEVMAVTLRVSSQMMLRFSKELGTDLREDYMGITRMREESTKCETFLGTLGNFVVASPEPVDLNKIRSAD